MKLKIIFILLIISEKSHWNQNEVNTGPKWGKTLNILHNKKFDIKFPRLIGLILAKYTS